MTAPSQERVEQGDLNRYPCGCWLRACSMAHDRSPKELEEERDRLVLAVNAEIAQVAKLRAALEQIEREWGTSEDNTPLIARRALNAEVQ